MIRFPAVRIVGIDGYSCGQNSGYEKIKVLPDQPLVMVEYSKLIHRNFPSLSTCYPQEICYAGRFFVVRKVALGEVDFTATKREQRGGTRRPMGWKRKAKGHVPGAEREKFGRGCGVERDSRSSLIQSSFQGRSGLRMTFGSIVTATGLRTRSKWARRPSGGKGSSKASGCVARHDAKTASEHLAPSPISAPRNVTRFVACGYEPRLRQLMQCRVYAPVRRRIHMSMQ